MSRHRIPGYPAYVYDTEKEEVISYKAGLDQPKTLKWRNVKGQLSVKLYDSSGLGIGTEMSKFKIRFSIQEAIDAKQKEKSMKRGKFIVGSIEKSTGNVSFSKKPKEHDFQVDAAKEAERLAIIDTNKSYVVAEIKGVVSVSGVSWS